MNTLIPGTAAPSSTPAEQDLHRQLIEQLYPTSIEHHGIDSEQTRMFAEHLSAYTGQNE